MTIKIDNKIYYKNYGCIFQEVKKPGRVSTSLIKITDPKLIKELEILFNKIEEDFFN